MTQRDRLIKLLEYAHNYGGDTYVEISNREELADYLLENGIIAPPCKIGDDLWYIDYDNKVECAKNNIAKIVYCGNEKFKIIDTDGISDDIGTRFAYLSKEDAEKALKEGVKE